MKPPEDDPVVLLSHWLDDFVKEHGRQLSPEMKTQLRDKSKELMEWAETVYEDDTEPGEEGSDLCPDCGSEMHGDPQILQIIPAPPGYRAVYAESDEHDPTRMAVEDVVCLELVRLHDGETVISGMTTYEDSFMPCYELASFMGYVPPGKNPDMYADKVKKFFEDQKEHEDENK